MKKRLFIAIPLPEDTKAKFSAIQRENEALKGLRWTTDENLHITVYFCGDVPEEDIPEMDKKLQEAAKNTKPFILDFKNFRTAPPNRPPGMVWGEYFGNDAFTKLVHAVYGAAKDFLDPRGAEKPPFKPLPHVTVCRFNYSGHANNIALPEEDGLPGPLNVKTFRLISSELTPRGPIYKTLYEYEIA